MLDYKLRLIEKEGYYAFEYHEVDSEEWKEIIIRENKDDLLAMTIPLKDEEDKIMIDEATGKVKTVLWPFYFDESE